MANLITALQAVAEQLSQRLKQLADQHDPLTATTEHHAPVTLVNIEHEHESAKSGHTVADERSSILPNENDQLAFEHPVHAVGVRELALAEYERREAQLNQLAATSIQRVYRGFRVRKAILPLLSRRKATCIPNGIPRSPPTPAPTIRESSHFDSPTNQPSPPGSPLYYARCTSPPVSPPQKPVPRPSYSPIASPPLQPDSMSVINIFTRGVLGGKYRISMEENGLLTLSLNKQEQEENMSENKSVQDFIQNINQSIADDRVPSTTPPWSSPVPSHAPSLIPLLVPGENGKYVDESHREEAAYDAEENYQMTPRHGASSTRGYPSPTDIPTTPPGKRATSPNSLYLQ